MDCTGWNSRSVAGSFLPAILLIALLAGAPSRMPAKDTIDAAANLAKVPLRLVDKAVISPVNTAVVRPIARRFSYVFRGPQRNVGRTRGVPGFGGQLTPGDMAKGRNLTADQKLGAYPGEYLIRNSTQMLERTLKVANQDRNDATRKVLGTLTP